MIQPATRADHSAETGLLPKAPTRPLSLPAALQTAHRRIDELRAQLAEAQSALNLSESDVRRAERSYKAMRRDCCPPDDREWTSTVIVPAPWETSLHIDALRERLEHHIGQRAESLALSYGDRRPFDFVFEIATKGKDIPTEVTGGWGIDRTWRAGLVLEWSRSRAGERRLCFQVEVY